MKKNIRLLPLVALLLLNPRATHAQGTAFTYQGYLADQGGPANGSYDFAFRVFDAASGGAPQGALVAFNDLAVSNGLFTVTIDPGANVFTGASRWLNIGVRPGVSVGAYTDVLPRQALKAAPYAAYAGGVNGAGVTGTLPASALTGVSGSGLTSLNAASLTSGTVADTRLSGNVALRKSGNTLEGNQIVASGNVGIGTSTPHAKLEVSDGAIGLQVIPGFLNGVVDPDSVTLEMLGNKTLGIWDSLAVSGDLQVGGGTGTEFLELRAPGSTPYIDFSGSADVDFNARIIYSGTNDNGLYYSAGKHVFSPGNVGIGTTTPTAPLSLGSSLRNTKLALYDDGTFAYGLGVQGNQFRLHTGTINDSFYFLGGPSGPTAMSINAGTGDVVAKGEVTCTAVNVTSDRNAKEQFKAVDVRDVLEKVVRLPISEWQYKAQSDVRHVGPMAQDFHAAFALGHDDKHIATVDEGGVALAAIQGLNEIVEEKNGEIDRLKAQNETLAVRLAAIERALGIRASHAAATETTRD